MHAQLDEASVVQAAQNIHLAFANYNSNFRRISRRARDRFEQRDWLGGRRDLSERIELYEKSVMRSVGALRREHGAVIEGTDFWQAVQPLYWTRTDDIPDGEFAKTFFNSVRRGLLRELDQDPTTVSDTADVVSKESPTRYPTQPLHYICWNNFEAQLEKIFEDFKFNTAYADRAADIEYIRAMAANRIGEQHLSDQSIRRIEMIHDVFFQSMRAFLVGKLFWADQSCPFIVVFENAAEGVRVEAVLMTSDEVSVLFGYTRSYFFVDIDPVEGAVQFIKSMVPHKPIDEIYTVLGRARQGKTERYRSFTTHLHGCDDRFVIAEGDRGLVMFVFTLPSYDLVFKIIRDNFGYPKNVSHEEVKKKYRLVFQHDRAGRLIDTQEFRNIEFPKYKFSPDLLDEMLADLSHTVHVDGDQVVFDHIYTERRLIPLNLYLRNSPQAAAQAAIIDYGQAITDLALTNIFPGDLLLKNFGVSRLGRVIFYDYDELTLVTDCNFRDVPQARSLEDEMRAESWFHVDDDDIFPEEFHRFLPIEPALMDAFMQHHGNLMTANWWRDIKSLHLGNAAPEVAPYYGLTAGRYDQKAGRIYQT
ncbi:MAG: bifunctional isocitrate dehydrogenase kinase/phosphatase [Pseudomonadota bacterium]